MSRQSNAGIILATQGGGGSGYFALPASGTTLDSDTITTPLAVNVGVANRVVLTLFFSFANVTQWVVRVLVDSTDIFNTLSGGSAQPAQFPPGTLSPSVSVRLAAKTPVLSVAQNDTQAGFQALDHTYSNTAVTTDYIYFPGNLAGKLMVQVTPTYPGAVTSADYLICIADVY